MTDRNLWQEVKDCHAEGLSKSGIARKLGLDRRTVSRLLTLDGPPVYRRKTAHKPGSKLDPFKDFLKKRVEDGLTNGMKLLREAERRGYTGRISTLRGFVAPLRKERECQACVRFETLPGEQAQVDWGYLMEPDSQGDLHRFHCCAIVLGYSRYLYAEFTARMDLLTLLRCHIHAFDYFGGVPQTILYDNMKQIILERDEVNRRYHYNPRFRDFSRYYSFRPRLCAPNRPQTKGKVESGVGYVKGNFGPGDVFDGLNPANNDLRVWLDGTANVRIHGTTRVRPIDRLPDEHLQPLPLVPYEVARVGTRLVTKDCFVSYEGNRYSVPFEYHHKTVTVKDRGDGRLRVYYQERQIANHELSRVKVPMILDPNHTAGLWQRTLGRNPPGRYPQTGMIRVGEILKEVVGPLLAQRPLEVYELAAQEETTGDSESGADL